MWPKTLSHYKEEFIKFLKNRFGLDRGSNQNSMLWSNTDTTLLFKRIFSNVRIGDVAPVTEFSGKAEELISGVVLGVRNKSRSLNDHEKYFNAHYREEKLAMGHVLDHVCVDREQYGRLLAPSEMIFHLEDISKLLLLLLSIVQLVNAGYGFGDIRPGPLPATLERKIREEIKAINALGKYSNLMGKLLDGFIARMNDSREVDFDRLEDLSPQFGQLPEDAQAALKAATIRSTTIALGDAILRP